MSNPLTPLGLAVEMHYKDIRLRRLSPRTQEQYAYMIGRFVDFLQGEDVAFVEAITPGHIRGWLLRLEDEGLKPASVNTGAKCVRAWLNFLVREGVLDASPMRTVPMPKLKRPRPVTFTPEEVGAILDAIHTLRDRALVLFLLDTGVRRAELVALDVGNVDLKRGVVYVRDGKGGKDRITFLGVGSRRAVRRYLLDRDAPPPYAPLWVSFTTGDRMRVAGVRMLFRRLREKTGISHLTPHTFRRTCALWCLRSGMDVYQVAAILGHSDITTLKHYIRFLEDDLRDAHSRHSPVDGYLSQEDSQEEEKEEEEI